MRILTLSDEVYDRLEAAAAALGITPEAWIVMHLPPVGPPARSFADLCEGLIGTFESDGEENLSGNHSEILGQILEEKRRQGTL